VPAERLVLPFGCGVHGGGELVAVAGLAGLVCGEGLVVAS